VHIPDITSLVVIISILSTAAVCSVWRERRLRITGHLANSHIPIELEVRET